MIKISIKPMTVNRAYKGRRHVTDEYKAWKHDIAFMLPKHKSFKGRLRLDIEFGFSNVASDIDNPVKSLTDALQNKYGFNDKNVYTLVVNKVIVNKGEDYLKFQLTEIK